MRQTQRDLLFKLTVCNGVGNLGVLKIVDATRRYQTANFSKEEIIQIAGMTMYKESFSTSWDYWPSLSEKLQAYQQAHQFITIFELEYPPLLKQIYNAPALLFYRGNLTHLLDPAIAFVGTREASCYGKKVIQRLLPKLIEHKLTIVSGLAKGIDSFSHQEAMKHNGKTIAVIGTGLDCCYPKEASYLQKQLMETQLVISEYPNGTGPKKYHFPMRNRIIAGLTGGTCVIEARKKSGSLITAQAALEYNRDVFAVPGNLLQPLSEGCNRLIQEGAKCLIDANDILDESHFFSILC